MRFLTKPVRNLLLATVFGTALVVVETEPVHATYPYCYDLYLQCIFTHQPDHEMVENDDAQQCYFGMRVLEVACLHLTSPTTGYIESSELCYDMTPSGTHVTCDEG